MRINRRNALGTLFAGTTLASCGRSRTPTAFTALDREQSGIFSSGVASGDPQATSVILWTRVANADGSAPTGPVSVEWQISEDEGFSSLVSSGAVETGPQRDGTVKLEATGLEPGGNYYFKFTAEGMTSPIGRTRTLPEGDTDNARFAVVSCSNYPFGYFNVYDQIARRNDLDAVLHLGDYIYEYGPEGYGGDTGRALGRNHEPAHEILTLADYRLRHRQYKSDPASQAMLARHPLIPIWDDHETSNNSWKDGAQNHSPETEGDWESRRRAALQAYYEWMPVREPLAGKAREAFFRSFSYGNLLTIAALETRLMARTEELKYADIVAAIERMGNVETVIRDVIGNKDREMLGAAQSQWLKDIFQHSHKTGQPWRLLANQIIMGRVTAPDLTPHVTEEDIVDLERQWAQARAFVEASTLGLPTNFDAWDGYPAARERLYDMIRKETNGDGLIVVTGDTHTWWANDLTAQSGEHMGVELGVNSVTSPSPYRREFLGGKGAEYALLTNQENKDVRYLNGENHGYIDLSITPQRAEARFMAVDRIDSREYSAFEKAAFAIKRKNGRAQFTRTAGLSVKESYLFR